jgi:hypothetical protein
MIPTFIILFFFGLLVITRQMLRPIQLSQPRALIKDNHFDVVSIDDKRMIVQIKKGPYAKQQRKRAPVTQYQES